MKISRFNLVEGDSLRTEEQMNAYTKVMKSMFVLSLTEETNRRDILAALVFDQLCIAKRHFLKQKRRNESHTATQGTYFTTFETAL